MKTTIGYASHGQKLVTLKIYADTVFVGLHTFPANQFVWAMDQALMGNSVLLNGVKFYGRGGMIYLNWMRMYEAMAQVTNDNLKILGYVPRSNKPEQPEAG